jgi:hypothetical protein
MTGDGGMQEGIKRTEEVIDGLASEHGWKRSRSFFRTQYEGAYLGRQVKIKARWIFISHHGRVDKPIFIRPLANLFTFGSTDSMIEKFAGPEFDKRFNVSTLEKERAERVVDDKVQRSLLEFDPKVFHSEAVMGQPFVKITKDLVTSFIGVYCAQIQDKNEIKVIISKTLGLLCDIAENVENTP